MQEVANVVMRLKTQARKSLIMNAPEKKRQEYYRKMLSEFETDQHSIDNLSNQEKFNLMLIILDKTSEVRTSSDIKMLTSLTKEVKFFKALNQTKQGSKIHESCCKYIQYRFFEPNSIVFKEG